MREAYKDYCSEDSSTPTFEEWHDQQMHESPQFQFWHLVLDMELIIFILIRSFREGNFTLYHEAFSGVIPYFFANNNVNYAHWLPVHLKNMMCLEQQHPEVAREFHKGNFVVHKSRREFSAIAINQAHEQNNTVIKGDGGAVGLTEDPGALWRWMVAGPELSRLIAEYEAMPGVIDAAISSKHHEQTLSAQRSFIEKAEALHAVLKEMGNPFQEDSVDLLVLDTKNIADQALAELVWTHQQRGQQQFQSLMEGMGNEGESTFYKPIKRNKVAFFRHEQAASSLKEKVLKVNCQWFSRLFISWQTRQCDLQEFFQHENQPTPASLRDSGKFGARFTHSHTETLCVLPSLSLARESTRGTRMWPLLCTNKEPKEPKVRAGQQ